MNLVTFSLAFKWLVAHGYLVMFAAMFVEGPITTTAAAFAVALGYFNPLAVFALSILGDIVADAVYYMLGYFSRISFIARLANRLGFTPRRVDKMDKLVHRHATSTIVALKLTPLVAAPGFILVGFIRFNFVRFLLICLIVSLVKTTLFMTIGYFFGKLFASLPDGNYILAGLLFCLLILYFVYQKLFAWLSKLINKNSDSPLPPPQAG